MVKPENALMEGSRFITLAISLALVVTAANAASAAVREEPMDSTASLARSLVLETMAGEPFDLAQLAGERTLIVTWASW